MNKKRYTTLADLPLTLRVEEVAAVLNIGRNTAYELIRSNAISSMRIGRQIRVPKQGVIAYLNAEKQPF